MVSRESSQDSSPIPPKPEKRPKGRKDGKEQKQEQEQKQGERKTVFHIGKTLWARYVSGWLSSVLVHIVILIALALFSLPPAATDQLRELFSNADKQTEELEDMSDEEEIDLDLDTPLSDEILAVDDTVETEPESISTVDDVAGAAIAVDLSELGFEKAPKSDLMAAVGAFSGQELGGRGEKARKALVARGGGNKASEAAVGGGLKWLAAHQMPDGGWSFRIDLHPKCKGQCRNAGTKYTTARAAATGLALMPFLGAGQTHKKGKYKKVVNTGLTFLVSQMGSKGNFTKGGNMYSHGIASIVLCEAFAMTKDNRLFEPAQRSINYICRAQDPIGGGWRYGFQDPGDTSVVGWQLMALKSANLGYLKVPGITIQKTIKFLDFVQADGGAFYGYTEPASGRPATTAVGLLCRMYLGWQPSDPGLAKGVKWLSKRGPSKSDIYYNYYATQVMHHWGGEYWEKWNRKLRDQLVSTQAREGHERGSWYVGGGSHGQEGAGRLYCTSINTMILEIYYRYLPIYQKESTESEFTVE